MTASQLKRLCRQWQKVLRLQDWQVEVRFARAREFYNRDIDPLGECASNLNSKQAKIALLDRQDYAGDAQIPYDEEEVLVHELLHLHFRPLGVEDGTLQDLAQEQAINAIAGALVALKRQNRRNPDA